MEELKNIGKVVGLLICFFEKKVSKYHFLAKTICKYIDIIEI